MTNCGPVSWTLGRGDGRSPALLRLCSHWACRTMASAQTRKEPVLTFYHTPTFAPASSPSKCAKRALDPCSNLTAHARLRSVLLPAEELLKTAERRRSSIQVAVDRNRSIRRAGMTPPPAAANIDLNSRDDD